MDREADKLDARRRSMAVYVAGLRNMSQAELDREFRFRDSLPDLKADIEAEVHRRKLLALRAFASGRS